MSRLGSIFSRPWGSQPQEFARSATSGLFVPSRGATIWTPYGNAVTGRQVAVAGSGADVGRSTGRMGVEAYATGKYLQTDQPAIVFSRLSWLMIVTPAAAPVGSGPFSSAFQSGQATLNWDHTNINYQGSFTLFNSGAYPTCKFTNGFTAGVQVVLAGTYDGTTLRVYRNGVLENSVAAANGLSGLANAAVQWLGGAGGTVAFSGASPLFVWEPERAWTAAEVAGISANPWQLFAPRPLFLATEIAASGITGTSTATVSLSGSSAGAVGAVGASPASVSLSGSAAAAVSVAGASSGTVNLTGTAAAAVAVTGASAGTITATGSGAGAVSIVGASAGTVTMTGAGTGTTTGAISGASAQTISLAGSAAGTVSVSGASTGAVTMTGSATGTAAGAGIIGQSVGQIILAGSAAGMVRISVASAYTFTMSGSATGHVDSGDEVLAALASRSRSHDGTDSRPAQLAAGRRTNSSTGNRPRQ